MTATQQHDHMYKVVLVGDATVGKTHILSRYMKNALPKNPKATIGVEFATRSVQLAHGGLVKAQIWDTAGQERYRAVTAAHYRRAVGALLVYDVTRAASFQHCQQWLNDLRENAEPDIVVMLVGNKVDLVNGDNPSARQVLTDQGAEFARQNNLLFTEASAVSALNVGYSFEHLLQSIYTESSKKQPVKSIDSMTNTGVGIQLAQDAQDDPLAQLQNSCAQMGCSVL